MRKSHFLSVAATVGLVIGLFIGAVGVASAANPQPGTILTGNNLYLPWVHNGDTMNGDGPWYGTVTVQNLNGYSIKVTMTGVSSGHATTATLNPFASETYSAAALSLATPGEGVTIQGTASGSAFAAGVRTICGILGPGCADTVPTGYFSPTNITSVTKIVDENGAKYLPTTDFTYTINNLTWPVGDTLSISWLAGHGPVPGTTYTVYFNYTSPGVNIAAVEKHVMPTASSDGTTTSATVAVDGYTAMSGNDFFQTDQPQSSAALYQSILPIVQLNSGWDSILHITNVSGDANVAATVTLYSAAGQGFAGPSVGQFTQILAGSGAGATWTIDLAAKASSLGLPANWIGSAFVSSNDQVLAQVDRVKVATHMAITNTAGPYHQTTGPVTQYAPLVFKDYNGWNTGFSIANLSDVTNNVQITYYDQSGNVAGQESLNIPPRAMEFAYYPSNGQDVSIHPTALTAAVIAGQQPFQASVDEVKYIGVQSQGMGHAMSYITPSEGANRNAQLALPLVQRGNAASGQGDTTGVNLFNPDANNSVTGQITFYDPSGAAVAPTITTPVSLTLGALQSATLYSLNYSEMPVGFQGSMIVNVTGGAGSLVGISNNVNYAVANDGSAAFNLLSTCGSFVGSCPDIVTLDPFVQSQTVGNIATLTATVTDTAGNVLQDVPVTFTVNGANAGTASPSTATVTTNNTGKAVFSYSNTKTGWDWVTATTPNGGWDYAYVQWTAGAPHNITLAPGSQNVVVGNAAGLTATVTDIYGNPVPGAAVTVTNAVSPSSTHSVSLGPTNTLGNGQASFGYTETTTGTDYLVAKTGLLVSNTVTVNWTAGPIANGTITVTCTNGAAGSGQSSCTATAKDFYGNVIPGATINFQVTSGSGTLTSNQQTTNGSGVAGPVTVSGTSATSVTVTAFNDVNGNGTYDAGTDIPAGNATVTLP